MHLPLKTITDGIRAQIDQMVLIWILLPCAIVAVIHRL